MPMETLLSCTLCGFKKDHSLMILVLSCDFNGTFAWNGASGQKQGR